MSEESETRRLQDLITEAVTKCDRCGREMLPGDLDCEYQERIAIHFRAGYRSVFGDGNLVELDLCQHCVKEVLGPWLRVTEDEPFGPQHRLTGAPAGAYQENQLTGSEAGPEEPRQSGWPRADE